MGINPDISGNGYTLYNGDCLSILPELDNKVDLVFVDLPYGTTNNPWDVIIPFSEMWGGIRNVSHERTVSVFTSAEPFTSKLVMSNIKEFKYDMIWVKTIASGQLNVRHRPLRRHENVLVFYSKMPTYNEQLVEGKPYTIARTGKYRKGSYGAQKSSVKHNSGYRHAHSVLHIPNPRVKGGHPTQKPEGLSDYFIKTFTNEGDYVLDFCMGSGTTGVSAIKLGRAFIGIEIDPVWFDAAYKRIRGTKEGL